MEQNWNRNGAGMEQNWKGNGAGMEWERNGNGAAMFHFRSIPVPFLFNFRSMELNWNGTGTERKLKKADELTQCGIQNMLRIVLKNCTM